MSTIPGQTPTPAGWYPDPAGSPQLRWWDGVSWTGHLQAAYPTHAPTYAAAPSYGAPAPAPAYGAPAPVPSVPVGTPAYGPVIWVITLLPLVSLLLLPLALAELDQAVIASVYGGYGYTGFSTGGLIAQAVSTLLSWAIYGAGVVLAFVDRRWLLRTGYAQPFHWAWALLSPVYPIGRSVVVHRRSGRGIAPMWVTIGLMVLSLVIGIVIVVRIFSVLLPHTVPAGTFT